MMLPSKPTDSLTSFVIQSEAEEKKLQQELDLFLDYQNFVEDEKSLNEFNEQKEELTFLMNQYISMRQELVKSYTKIEATQVKIAKYLPEKEMIEMEFKKLEKENEFLEEECNRLKRTRDRISKHLPMEETFKEQNLIRETHASQMNILNNDFKLVKMLDEAESGIIESIKKYQKRVHSPQDTTLMKYSIYEMLFGIKVIEYLSKKDSNSTANKDTHWYDIMYVNVPDEILNFEDNFENHPLVSVKKSSQLSNELVEKYRSIFKKRKKSSQSNNSNKQLLIHNLNDFQIMYDLYAPILCYILTRQEIEEAKNKFALDWIEGSQVITVLINSKSSKMATIVLPKFYPFCGTSMIKLTSLSGYDNSIIKNFKIEENLSSLSEWIDEFGYLYNSNMIK